MVIIKIHARFIRILIEPFKTESDQFCTYSFSCRKKGSQAIWENRKTLRSFLFGGRSKEGVRDRKKEKKEKKKKKKGKLKKLKKLRRKKKNN